MKLKLLTGILLASLCLPVSAEDNTNVPDSNQFDYSSFNQEGVNPLYPISAMAFGGAVAMSSLYYVYRIRRNEDRKREE